MSEELEQRIAKLEQGDRQQAKQIRLIQKLQSALFGALAVGALLSQSVIQDPGNRELLERIAIGIVAASASGLGLSGFINGPTQEKDSE